MDPINDVARHFTQIDEWPDPVPFDQYSSLPGFPIDALSGVSREMVKTIAEVNQVDAALPGCFSLGVLSTCLAKKATVDLITHGEPLNLYLSAILDSGGRKSRTDSDMTKPLYEYQKTHQDEMDEAIRDAQVNSKVRERRLEKLQKKAAEDEDSDQREQARNEALNVAREMDEHPVPTKPEFLVDDVTAEKLGVLMAENNERMAVLTCEGGLLEIMGGRYSKDGSGNLDLFLKAHAGDYWGNHRIGREKKTMAAPALTLCLAVQSDVIEEAGRTPHFRGKGLLARFLYARCKSQVGYRERQTASISATLRQTYLNHIFSLMDVPFADATLRLSQDAQIVWDDFYNDVEREMRREGSLFYLPDWGSKLPGAVARI
ncbi:MAG: YfjI family protein, partial [Syntrophorhabdales bacterium]